MVIQTTTSGTLASVVREGEGSGGFTVVFQTQFAALRLKASLHVVVNDIGFRGMECGVREAGACYVLQQSHGGADIR